ncbi:MAG: Abi-alpha family protein [Bacteroidia bacterium]
MGDLNIKSTTIEKGLDLAKDFLSKLLGQSVEEMGLLFADKVKIWRLKNQIRNLEKVRAIVEKENLDLKQINLKVLVPYLDGVSLEEDEQLQDMWANLFVNYIDKNKLLQTHVYPSILQQLSTDEVKILEHFILNIEIKVKGSKTHETWKPDINETQLSNIIRLGLIEPRVVVGSKMEIGFDTYPLDKAEVYRITRFGEDFYYACKRKKDN